MMFHERAHDVEAHRWDGTTACLVKLREWAWDRADVPDGPNMLAAAPERARGQVTKQVHLEPGDWVVKTLDGVFFGCQHEWFEDVYTPAQEA